MNTMNITKDLKNGLLKRREVELVFTSDKNPGIKEATKEIANNFKANEDVIVIKRIVSRFGRDSFSIESFIYDSVADKNRVEPKKKEKKKAEGSS